MTLVPGFLSPFLFIVQLAGTPAPGDSARIAAREEVPVYYLPPLHITAPRPLFPGSQQVLRRERLTQLPAEQVAQALTRVAGLRVLSFGDASSRAVSIRGLGPDRTAVLVDGVPRNVAQGGPVELGAWNLDSVELIQVSRGAMGALYGPYALGGAVNLERRQERVSTGSLRLSAGTLDRASMAMQGTLVLDRSALSTTLGYENLAPELAGHSAESETKHGEIRAAWYPRWASSVAVSLEGRSDTRDVPGTEAFPSPEARRNDTTGALAFTASGMRWGFAPGRFDLNATGLRFERHYEDP
ncbi:MAG TPA: TonB-dependent receptor plug domain-containing protein, partial [Candidatus Eisenbacteria bacterium]|nr:TonB-dependent receptor plug domain-containing protein [Candidatus Eisenbacteria bacterium]